MMKKTAYMTITLCEEIDNFKCFITRISIDMIKFD